MNIMCGQQTRGVAERRQIATTGKSSVRTQARRHLHMLLIMDEVCSTSMAWATNGAARQVTGPGPARE